ncbi:MAG TPA: dihydropteroate synthase, partial [Tepidisphaeraceae bacterium]|nr:dihydropteroate synthase [Tepidisphaeraceae bacterium]
MREPLIMGVLNVTPDSFSDGGRFIETERAAEHARAMVAAGASIIDVGGESTRPGAEPVSEDEQLSRVIPVIEAISDIDALISIDTTRATVAEAAINAGANLINDVSAGRDDLRMLSLAAKTGVPIVLMHRKGSSLTMQVDPHYDDVVGEIVAFLLDRIDMAIRTGIHPSKLLVDPGIGFGKTLEHNLKILRSFRTFASLGQPTVLGVSRKRFIGQITGVSDPASRI